MSRVAILSLIWALWVPSILIIGGTAKLINNGFLTGHPVSTLAGILGVSFLLWMASVPVMVIIWIVAFFAWLFEQTREPPRVVGYRPPPTDEWPRLTHTITERKIR